MPYIPLEIYANNPSTTVSSGGTTAPAGGTSETWTVVSSASFPAPETGATQFHVADPALPSEIITVVNVSGTTWTVTRGAEASVPVAHTAGFTVVQVITAGVMASAQYPAWQFPVEKYGAQGDGKMGSGGTGASGQAVFTDAAAHFINATAPAGDVGKYIIINQGAGGSATNPFVGTIISVNSATSITLSASLAATCASAPYVYGTDDAAAINAAVAAAVTFATTYNYKGQVMFEPLLYMLGSVTQTTSPYKFNTQVQVPVGAQLPQKIVLDFIGVGDASEPVFWNSTVPSLQGTCLVSAMWVGSVDATFGQQSVIGGPTDATGLTPSPWANTLVNIDGITVCAPWNSMQIGFDFRNVTQANIGTGSYLAFAPVNASSQTVGGPYLGNKPTNGQSVGLYMPLAHNNDNCNIGLFAVENAFFGVVPNEHTTAVRLACIYCDTGIFCNIGGTGGNLHGASILYASVEACNTALAGAGSIFPIFIGQLDVEQIGSGFEISDSSNALHGVVYWIDVDSGSNTPLVNGAQSLTIVNTKLPPGAWAGPAAPASNTAQQNTAWRPATIYMSATTGITVVKIDSTTTGLTAGNGVMLQVHVPAGHSYTVTYTGVLTTSWVLD
jgi:hypothetical protein